MAKKSILVSVDEATLRETDRQIAEINQYRKKGNKLTRSAVVSKMLGLFNRTGNGKT